MAPEQTDSAFDELLRWLERDHEGFQSNVVCRQVAGSGRSLFAARDLDAEETLLQIPSSALLNPITIQRSGLSSIIPQHLFPATSSQAPSTHVSKKAKTQREPAAAGRKLNTTQLLTLQLALARCSSGKASADLKPWAPYLATLPADFSPWHPLTWLEDGKLTEPYRDLVDLLPYGGGKKLKAVQRRYEGDRDLLRLILRGEEPFRKDGYDRAMSDDHFLWAWLTVNTRTVSLPLGIAGATELQNHSLVPLLDFINHSSDRRRCCPSPRQFASHSSSSSARSKARNGINGPGEKTGLSAPRPSPFTVHLVPGRIGFRIVAGPDGIRAGDELFFQYGGHDNATLFSEYGFVDVPPGAKWLDNVHGEIDVGWAVDDLWESTDEREDKEKALRAIGCWDVNTLRTCPTPPHPSYGLQMTLRVIHLSGPDSQAKLAAITRGAVTYISPANEEKATLALKAVCERVVGCATANIDRLKALGHDLDNRASFVSAREMVVALYDEELAIAKAVMARIEADDTNW